ncbi:MAG TPA: glycoside hydrolase family 2 TIM barrel-domain containing protein, partial [Polyangiales bacterium]|nr:glycoside hydrolase family 2 TIM barrel-domain containing protein [Polyangiales bacterium]
GTAGPATPPSEAPPPQPAVAPPGARAPPTQTTVGPNDVEVYKDENGYVLMIDGKPTMVFGMNWGYMPIGENYTYDFWGKPDDVIIEALDREMRLLKEMGVNVIRQYLGIPPRWVEYIYEKYGIYTVLNHTVGRYGMTIDGVWVNPIDYSDPRFRSLVKEQIAELVAQYKDTPGFLMWLLGNENNYGLYWKSNEIEDLPEAKQGDARATYLYSLFGELTDLIHSQDPNHPVAIANGDLGFLEVIKEECPNIDVFGSNVYRGPSSGDIFERVHEELGLPFMYTEFGADAFDAKRGMEDQIAQAVYLQAQWQEIYEQSYGKGRVQNAIGGMIFQWSDGWWKYQQEINLDEHDTTASWANAAYPHDYVEGENNMNEEWFGITSKGRSNARGIYDVYPRAAYYVLEDAFELDPYAPGTDLQKIRLHFGRLGPRMSADTQTKLSQLEKFRPILRFDFNTYTTGGRQLTDPERERTRFDHTESFFFGFETKPVKGVRADIVVNGLGNVARNPINEIFYENRGLPIAIRDPDGEVFALTGANRFQVYQASFDWDSKYFLLESFFRGEGHYHWGYEGDFFGLYPEVHQQFDIDTYNANAPVGLVFAGKNKIEGLKIAFGPQLWWGANPSILGKYYRTFGDFKFAVIHQEDIAQQQAELASSAIPQPKSRKSTLYFGYAARRLTFEVGGMTSRSNFIGDNYEVARQVDETTGSNSYLESGYYIADGKVNFADTLGGRAKLTLNAAPVFWYIQGGYQGLVADGGADQTMTITGWSLKESGQGNHWAVSTGLAYYINKVMLGPNFLVQRPIEGPLPFIEDFFDAETGIYYPGVQGRNQLDDPFWVRSNRETYGFELLLGWDPTPATPMYAWDNAQREDALMTVALDFVYKILPTSQDAAVAINQDLILFAFPTGAPARNLWETSIRTITNFRYNMRLVNWIYTGQGQANGDDPRTVTRYGFYGWFTYSSFNINYHLKIDDWGPYDYHKDFNLTFPLQVMLDLSYAYEPPKLYAPAATRFGVRGEFRNLDRFSNRYRFDPLDPDRTGREWEIKTYVQFNY